jgi:hypothetical protein
MIAARLKINIIFDEQDKEKRDLVERVLDQAAMHLADNGLLSGDRLIVESWSHDVEVEYFKTLSEDITG